jgi:hypothetical protein
MISRARVHARARKGASVRTPLDFREMAMNKKFMSLVLGYLLLLAALEFALDAGIVAMIVRS